MKKRIIPILIILNGSLTLLWGQSSDTTDTTRPNTVTVHPKSGVSVMPMDEEAREVIERLFDVGKQEVELSRIAAERATNPQVKAFAEEMIGAHTASRDELKSLMTTAGQTPPQANTRAVGDREWIEKDADDFDEDYMEKMVELHEENLDALDEAAESVLPQLRAYAERHQPIVKSHLERAKALAEAVD